MLEFDVCDELFIGDKILQDFGDCLSCGLCCKVFPSIEVATDEIKLIVKKLNIDSKQFAINYLKTHKSENGQIKLSLKTPCPFQEDNHCKIHEIKPFDCKTFPLLINITSKIAVLNGIYLCPQATQFYEGFLEFCKINDPKTYEDIIGKEKTTELSQLGLKLTINSEKVSNYIDWICSDKQI